MGKRSSKESKALSEMMRDEIDSMIKHAFDSRLIEEITKQDIKEILEEVLPDLDKMISKKIKTHLINLAEHLIKTLKKKE